MAPLTQQDAADLLTWILNVATDAQLDSPVPRPNNITGRALIVRVMGDGDHEKA